MKKKRKFILRTAFWSAAAALIYFPAADVTTLYLYTKKDPDIEHYVQENLKQIIEQQEQKLGITYPAERPKIEYTFPYDNMVLGASGVYNDKENTIYLPSGILTKPEWDFEDFMATVFTFNTTANAKRVLDHELTHFYCDKMKEQVLGEDYHIFAININIFIPE